MRFKVWYGDGSVRTGSSPEGLPINNVQVIVQEALNDRGFTLLHGKGTKGSFIWRGEKFVLADEIGFWEHIINGTLPVYFLLGRTMERDEEFWAILTRAEREGLD